MRGIRYYKLDQLCKTHSINGYHTISGGNHLKEIWVNVGPKKTASGNFDTEMAETTTGYAL